MKLQEIISSKFKEVMKSSSNEELVSLKLELLHQIFLLRVQASKWETKCKERFDALESALKLEDYLWRLEAKSCNIVIPKGGNGK